jgi:hypothetical protein
MRINESNADINFYGGRVITAVLYTRRLSHLTLAERIMIADCMS